VACSQKKKVLQAFLPPCVSKYLHQGRGTEEEEFTGANQAQALAVPSAVSAVRQNRTEQETTYWKKKNQNDLIKKVISNEPRVCPPGNRPHTTYYASTIYTIVSVSWPGNIQGAIVRYTNKTVQQRKFPADSPSHEGRSRRGVILGLVEDVYTVC
jgi:hypothetical protein